MIKCIINKAFYLEDNQGTIAKPVLNDIEINIADGVCVSVIGPSGCGKSTLLKIIAGLHSCYEGKVTGLTSRIGFLPQTGLLLPWKTVFQNTVSLKSAVDKQYSETEALSLLDSLGILEHANKYPSRLSGGQAQRAALARILFLKPKLMLVDEPFSALDESTREEIQLVFHDIRTKHGISAVFVTHSIDEALVLGDEIFIMSQAPGTIKARFENKAGRIRDEDFYIDAARLRKFMGR